MPIYMCIHTYIYICSIYICSILQKIPSCGLELFNFCSKDLQFRKGLLQRRNLICTLSEQKSPREQPDFHAYTWQDILPSCHILSQIAHFHTCSCGTSSASMKAPFEGMLLFFCPLRFMAILSVCLCHSRGLMKASFRQLQFLKGTNYASSPASLPAMNAFRNQWSFHMADGSLGLSST